MRDNPQPDRGRGVLMPNAFAHVELQHAGPEESEKFYQSLFDWKLSDAPGGMPYTMINVGTAPAAGMGALQEPGVPSAGSRTWPWTT